MRGWPAVSSRRIGTEESASRAALVDAAQALMLEEGYASVTSRRVAARAGLKPQLVHYYFRTMDELFLAVLRRGAERNLARQAKALASEQPLWALWALGNEPAGTALTIELTALANHRKSIKADIAEQARRFRRQQLEVVTEVLEGYGVDTEQLPPAAAALLMHALNQVLALEEGLGVDDGHAEARALVERWLTELEGPLRSPSRRRPRPAARP
jgi:TetR/AcrR family transcriptional regulator